jgi:hypothetical protein
MYYAHCYVKAGTATSARIVLDGTAATITGLSSSTWSIVEVADASASAASIVFEVDVGSVVATTGTVVFGGCQVEAGTYRTSIIPTTAVALGRVREAASFPLSIPISPLSLAGTREGPPLSAAQPNIAIVGVPAISLVEGNNLSLLYGNSSGLRCWNNNNLDQRVGYAPGGLARGWCAFDSANATPALRVQGEWPTGSAMTDVSTGSGGTATSVGVTVGSFGASQADGLISRICVDPDPSRCR